MDGDGSPDCIAVEPLLFGSSNPVVNAYSGKDGTTIHALSFPQGPNGLGLAIGAGADYTGDGVPDILLGSPGANAPPAIGLPSSPFGGVYIYSGKTGQFARARLGNGVIGFGTQIWCMPDVNSDGIADYAVLVGGPAAAGLASVQVLSGSDDALLTSVSALQAFDGFGLSFEVFDDFTGDGIPDFAMGAPYHQANGIFPGIIRFFSGASGAEYAPIVGVNDADVVGLAIASLGDSDGNSNVTVRPYTPVPSA
ncbi:MAG: hypothetical protein IPH13_22580 [Planctomycetes bacterium]|nr:hypothetical protein [Planctomycetota bacterium]